MSGTAQAADNVPPCFGIEDTLLRHCYTWSEIVAPGKAHCTVWRLRSMQSCLSCIGTSYTPCYEPSAMLACVSLPRAIDTTLLTCSLWELCLHLRACCQVRVLLHQLCPICPTLLALATTMANAACLEFEDDFHSCTCSLLQGCPWQL